MNLHLCNKHDFYRSKSDSERDIDVDFEAELRSLYDSQVKISKDNIQLVKEKMMLEAKVNKLELEEDQGKIVCEFSMLDMQCLEQR